METTQGWVERRREFQPVMGSGRLALVVAGKALSLLFGAEWSADARASRCWTIGLSWKIAAGLVHAEGSRGLDCVDYVGAAWPSLLTFTTTDTSEHGCRSHERFIE